MYTESVIKLIEISRIGNYKWIELSGKEEEELESLEMTFVNLYEEISGNRTMEDLDVEMNESEFKMEIKSEIEDNVELSEAVLSVIEAYFESIYPDLVDMDFAEHYGQNWVMVLYGRNSKWHEIKDFAFSYSVFGQIVSRLTNQLIHIPSKNSSHFIILKLKFKNLN